MLCQTSASFSTLPKSPKYALKPLAEQWVLAHENVLHKGKFSCLAQESGGEILRNRIPKRRIHSANIGCITKQISIGGRGCIRIGRSRIKSGTASILESWVCRNYSQKICVSDWIAFLGKNALQSPDLQRILMEFLAYTIESLPEESLPKFDMP
jgi:hypothetical protein